MTDRSGESAVSAVVGAVLLVALFTTMATLYTVQTLPDWKADKEHNQQLAVQAAFGGLRSDIDALATREGGGPVTAVIALETPRVPLLQQTPARAALRLEDGLAATFAFATAPTLYLSDGASTATPALSAGVVPAAPCAGACIASVDGFVLGVATSGLTGTVTGTVTVTDSAASPATLTAQVAHIASGGTCPGEVRLTVGTVQTPLLCTGTGTAVGSVASPYRIDLLNPAYTFSGSVARLTPPLTVAFDDPSGTGTMTVGHAMAYEDSSGVLQVTGTGVATAAPVLPIDSQRLVYSPAYQSFPSQDLVLEGGAVLVDAGADAQAMAGQAPLAFGLGGGVGSLDWTLIQFDGTGAIAGAREATVTATYGGAEDVVFTLPAACPLGTPCATVTLETPGAAAWGSFLTLQAGLAGVSDSVQVATDPVAGTATLSLGSDPALAVTGGWVVHLRILHVTLDVS